MGETRGEERGAKRERERHREREREREKFVCEIRWILWMIKHAYIYN